MDWKDTVMSPEDLVPYLSTTDLYSAMCVDYEKAFGKQAEIAYKAGRDSFLDDVGNATIPLSEAHKKGVRKVVEWIEEKTFTYHVVPYDKESLMRNILEDMWQSQKKIWGIDGH